jgi:2'-5' RNA ligase
VIVAFPQAEPAVGALRAAHDASAPLGVPAHVTLLFPFVPVEDLTDGDLDALRAICAAEPAFDVVFRQVRRWPTVIWLDPEPAEPFRRLTEAIVARWPQRLPYGGLHPTITPHLTIVEGDPLVFDAAQQQVVGQLPISARADQVQLIAFDGARYVVHARFPFGT